MEGFKNKRILLVCREVYSYPFFFLAQKWSNKNDVAAYFFSPSEVRNHKNPSNEFSYYAFKEIKNVTLYTSLNISNQFEKIQHEEKVIDSVFLSNVEKKYTHYLNLNSQIISTQSFSRHYHFRNYWTKCTYVQQMNWLILNYQDVIRVLEDFKPDVVLDCDNAELGRCVMREVCYNKQIPYLFTDHPRYELFRIISPNLGLHVSDVFAQKYNENYQKNNMELTCELEYVKNFKCRSSIMNPMFKNDVTSQYKSDGWIKSFKIIANVIKLLYKQDIKAHNYNLKRRNQLLHSNSFEFIKFFVKLQFRKEYLYHKNKLFSPPIEGEKYVYMPLHLIPESTTFSLAPLYINELSIIEAVSKSLPIGWKLYVKEHQAMLGERDVDFYKKVNAIPNAQMVQLNYYSDPKPWIVNSQGVVTISGTSAYEAALLGKHAIVFSDVPFSLISGVKRVHSFEELPSELKSFSDKLENEKSCAAYIATVKELGKPVDMKRLIAEAPNYIKGNIQPNDSFSEMLINLEQLFINAYSTYNHKKNK